MMSRWKRFLFPAGMACATLCGYAFQTISTGEKQVSHQTPEQVYAQWLERELRSRQPSDEEREVIKMCLWMSYLSDKAVTSLLKAINNAWEPSSSQLNMRLWPRCIGVIIFFVDLEPFSWKEPERHLRRYVVVDGKKGVLTTYPTPIPWLAGWDLSWICKREQRLDLTLQWFRSIEAIDEEWPYGDEASYEQVYGIEAAAVISYAIKHGSFSGAVIGDDSFFPYGEWFGFERKYREKHLPNILVFRKANFLCRLRLERPGATQEEKQAVEQVARLVEAEIIAYSLFGLEKFTILIAKSNDEDLYLPAGHIGVGSYLVPVKYVVERVTGKKPFYDANLRQMRVEVKGREEIVRGELIEAANKYFPIPEEERLVANWEAIQSLLGLQKVQDIRFE